MKKNQNGVSMISLVITIIVIIILAAVAFSSSTDTITNANFSNFTNNIGEVRTAFATVATTIKGQEAQQNITRTDAQVYNFVAKGGTTIDAETRSGEREAAWLPRGTANVLACTQIDKAKAKEVLDMELPIIRVSTDSRTNVECSYFVTREGAVFVWPPYEYQNEFYVNDNTKLTISSGDNSIIRADSGDTGRMYANAYDFRVGDVIITTSTATPTAIDAADVKTDTATVYYEDVDTAGTKASPIGITVSGD